MQKEKQWEEAKMCALGSRKLKLYVVSPTEKTMAELRKVISEHQLPIERQDGNNIFLGLSVTEEYEEGFRSKLPPGVFMSPTGNGQGGGK